MRSGRHPQGFSLVMVLILLAALALGAAASLRLATGAEKVASGYRMQALALHSAESALRYCEAQLLLPDAQRIPALQDAALLQFTAASPAWVVVAVWKTGKPVTVPPEWWQGAGSTYAGQASPLCLVERQPLGAGQVHVVTARGVGPDWRADPATGTTLSGAVAWLQSVVLIHEGKLRDRVQRRLLQPPLK